jgi:hypothetical protein
MSDETEQAAQAAPWIVAALATIGALGKRAFGRSERRDNVLVKLLTDCERRLDERDAKVALLEVEVRKLATEHATLKAEHATCAPRIAQLEARLDSERPTDSPPALPVQHKEVGHAE